MSIVSDLEVEKLRGDNKILETVQTNIVPVLNNAENFTTRIHPQALRECIDDDELDDIAQYRMRKPLDEVTDDDLLAYLQVVQKRNAKGNKEHNLKELLKKAVIMDMSIQSSHERVDDLFGKFNRFVRDRHLDDKYKGTEKKVKKKIKILYEGIRPKELKDMIFEEIEFGDHEDAWYDEIKFFDLVDKLADEQQRNHISRIRKEKQKQRNHGNGGGGNGGGGGRNTGSNNKDSGTNQSTKKTEHSGKQPAAKIPDHVRENYEKKKPPEGGCAFCKGDHWLPLCTKVTPEKRKELLTQIKEKNQHNQQKDQVTPVPTKDTYRAQTSDIRKCLVRKFENPVTSKLAKADEIATMIGLAILDLTFTSQQGTQVTLRRVECLVSRNDLSDNVILIGRRELDILGINPDDIFEDKYSNHADSVELVCSYEDRLQNLTTKRFRVETSNEAVTQPDPGDDYFVDVGDFDKSEVDKAIDSMVDRAGEEGLPIEHKSELRRIVYDRHDVWRINWIVYLQ
ncbi:hypothetical protein PBRA_008995 [Plasmodiophora brassicae]|uniref:Uncharacterized protein n=1 Tax=Plasmodiophora brassicae TaxID=37360 RepID=A0A0G4J537_PLABS|nr:hypothetical protein PBRA_008995 [Plasmodiophora brassicae]